MPRYRRVLKRKVAPNGIVTQLPPKRNADGTVSLQGKINGANKGYKTAPPKKSMTKERRNLLYALATIASIGFAMVAATYVPSQFGGPSQYEGYWYENYLNLNGTAHERPYWSFDWSYPSTLSFKPFNESQRDKTFVTAWGFTVRLTAPGSWYFELYSGNNKDLNYQVVGAGNDVLFLGGNESTGHSKDGKITYYRASGVFVLENLYESGNWTLAQGIAFVGMGFTIDSVTLGMRIMVLDTVIPIPEFPVVIVILCVPVVILCLRRKGYKY